MDALFAPTVEPLRSKRQQVQQRLLLPPALARRTPLEMVPHALVAQAILLHLLDLLPELLATAMRTFTELLEPLPVHANRAIMAAPLPRSHPILPPQPLAAGAKPTPTQQQ